MRSAKVCPRCLWIRPKGTKDCACTVRMAAVERALRELDPDNEAFEVNPQLAAATPDGEPIREGGVKT